MLFQSFFRIAWFFSIIRSNLLELNHLTAELEEDGNTVLTDEEAGELFGRIPKGFMTDAAGERSDLVSYSLTDRV